MRFLAVLVLLTGGPAAGVWAQPCERTLAQAQDRYSAGAFEEVEAFVTACLVAEGATGADFVRAYRLQALTFLRLRDLDASKAEVLKLLGVNADYEPDPVLDPPDYVGLVRVVKEQFQVTAASPSDSPAPVAAPPVELLVLRPVVPAPPPSRSSFEPHGLPDSLRAMRGPPLPDRAQSPASRMGLEGGLGLNHNADGGSDAGAGLQLGLSYDVHRSFALGLLYEAGRYPNPTDLGDPSTGVIPPPPPPPGEAAPAAEPLDEGGSSPWLHQASVVLRATLVRWAVGRGAVEPYALAAVTAAVGRLGGTPRVGVGPRVGIGIEGAVGPRVAVFAEAQGTLAFPALDDQPTRGRGYSPLSGVRIGVRFGFVDTQLDRPHQRVGTAMVPGGEAREPAAQGLPAPPSSTAPVPDPPPPADGGN